MYKSNGFCPRNKQANNEKRCSFGSVSVKKEMNFALKPAS